MGQRSPKYRKYAGTDKNAKIMKTGGGEHIILTTLKIFSRLFKN